MKRKNGFLLLASLFLSLLFMTGSAQAEAKMYSEPQQLSEYLHKIDFADYREDSRWETIEFAEAFGCSSVRNGNFYGRNFDFIYNDVPSFVVRVAAKEGRHASIGVATHFGLREGKLLKGEYDKQLELIPNFTLDGINDAGVICSHNVVPIKAVEPVTGTNPAGKDLNMLFIPRFVLDNASSADEAVELIKSRNIVGNLHNECYLHIMIADKDKTYVVEFIDNKVKAVEKKGNEQIMTNFNVNLPKYPDSSLGIERYAILQKNYDMGNTFEGMFALMQKVKFSLAFRISTHPHWYTDKAIPLSVMNQPGFYKDYQKTYKEECFAYWKARLNDKYRAEANGNYWLTVHNSTYDIEKKMFRVIAQERYKKTFEFYLEE